MNIKPGFILRNVCGENVIVSEGLENIDFSQIISMNETAAAMWRAVVDLDAFTLQDMVSAVTEEYEVTEEEARKDAENLLKQWIEIGLVDV